MNPVEQINHIIRNRRSIYPAQYSGEVIEDSIIENILENANWAPNHGLTEPWRFVVFKGKGLHQLAEFQSNLYKELSQQSESFDEKKFEKLLKKPLLASHIISIGMKRDEREKIPEIEEVEAVACAVQNMYLTAYSYGIGCYWGSGGITYQKKANEFFGLSEKDLLLGFLYLGIPKFDINQTWPQGKRGDIKNKVKWVS